jgi:hypothetical protein
LKSIPDWYIKKSSRELLGYMSCAIDSYLADAHRVREGPKHRRGEEAQELPARTHGRGRGDVPAVVRDEVDGVRDPRVAGNKRRRMVLSGRPTAGEMPPQWHPELGSAEEEPLQPFNGNLPYRGLPGDPEEAEQHAVPVVANHVHGVV